MEEEVSSPLLGMMSSSSEANARIIIIIASCWLGICHLDCPEASGCRHFSPNFVEEAASG